MSLRQRLLLLFSLTVAAAVAAVAWTVLIRIRHVFEQRDQEETALFVSQFQREFQNRSADIAASVDRLAATERVRVMASAIAQSGDSAPYLTESQSLAQQAELDFLEIVGPDGNVISSAQWPARFGYPEPAAKQAGQAAFLKREDLPDETSALGLFAVRSVPGSQPSVLLIGGRRIDRQFLADLPDAPGMQIALYSVPSATAGQNPVANSFDSKQLIAARGDLANAESYRALISSALTSGQQQAQIIDPTGNRADSLSASAIPLKDTSNNVLAVLIVALSRGGMVEAQQHIRSIAYGVASGGILLAIALSLWIAARVSRPIEELARAAE